jgi:hypothetical protein
MQLKKLFTGNIPVKASGIDVKDLVTRQKYI